MLFDIGFSRPPVPQYVERRIGFGTPEWAGCVPLRGGGSTQSGSRVRCAIERRMERERRPVGAARTGDEEARLERNRSDSADASDRFDCRLRRRTPVRTRTSRSQNISANQRAYGDVAVIGYRLPEVEQPATPRPVADRDLRTLRCSKISAIRRRAELIPDADGNAFAVRAFPAGAVPRALTIAVRGEMLPRARSKSVRMALTSTPSSNYPARARSRRRCAPSRSVGAPNAVAHTLLGTDRAARAHAKRASSMARAWIARRKRPASACWRDYAATDTAPRPRAEHRSAQHPRSLRENVARRHARLAPARGTMGRVCDSAGRSPAAARCRRPPRASASKWTSSMRAQCERSRTHSTIATTRRSATRAG